MGLFTTVNEAFDRVAMHAVRRDLLEAQAASAGLPLHVIPIPWPCPNEAYEAAMARFVEEAKERGVTHFAFGDLFLEDIRRYREQKLAGTGIAPVFPVWGLDTRQLAREMVRNGVRACVTCVDPKVAPKSWAGRIFDPAFVEDIPEGIDPCGERGEFHTFVFEGPMLRSPLKIKPGATVERDGFVFADVIGA